MAVLHALLSDELILLFLTVAFGMALGSIKVRGLSLGSSGVLFVALVFGHYGYQIPKSIGILGLVLFVYCIGISAGSRFFSSLRRHGVQLAKLSALIVGTGALAAWALAKVLSLPVDLAAGLFAGALTSTPALAAAFEALPPESLTAIGYGIAYPFGVIGVVLTVQLLPRLLGIDLGDEAKRSEEKRGETKVVTTLVEVTNPNLFGKRIEDSELLASNRVRVSRVLQGERLMPLRYDNKFEQGQNLLLVGHEDQVPLMVEFLGRRSEKQSLMDVDRERRQVVLTNAAFIGKTLRELGLLKSFGIVVSRITRNDVTFVPSADTVLENLDRLTVVGFPEDLQRFSAAAGHRPQAVEETDILSLAVGITAGVVLGIVPIALPGSPGFTFGLAGGPLIVGLLMGHFGRVGRIVGHMPRASRILMRELGLVLFLAEAGMRGGSAFVDTVGKFGPELFLVGTVVTLLPMVVAFPVAHYYYRFNLLETLGGMCGGMTSTPALGVIASTDSQLPLLSYSTAYPFAMVLMIIFTELLVRLI